MSVISVAKVPMRRRGRVGSDYTREYFEVWRVRTSDPTDDEVVVTGAQAVALGLPNIYDPHPRDSAALVNSYVPTEGDMPTVWLVEVQYSTDASDKNQEALNPLDEAASVDYGEEKVDVATQWDLDAKVFANSAGDPYDPPVALEDTRKVVTVTKNVSTFWMTDQDKYLRKCNDSPLWGNPVATVLCSQFTGRKQYRSGTEFYARTTQFKVLSPLEQSQGQTWETLKLVDQGFRQVKAGALVPIFIGGQPVSKPVLLNGSGAIQTARPPALFTNSFRVRGRVEFNDLNLPADI